MKFYSLATCSFQFNSRNGAYYLPDFFASSIDLYPLMESLASMMGKWPVLLHSQAEC